MSNSELDFIEARLEYTENTIKFGDLEPVVNSLAEDFMFVKVTRRRAGTMASPLFGDVAIAFILGAAAAGFLSELGKDAYRGLRAGLFALYEKAKTMANDRGYYPFAIERELEEPISVYHFTFPEGLGEEEFEDALLTIPEALQDIEEDAKLVGLKYVDGSWKSTRIK